MANTQHVVPEWVQRNLDAAARQERLARKAYDRSGNEPGRKFTVADLQRWVEGVER